MARVGSDGPRSTERLYRNSKGELTTEKAGILVAAPGAPIAPEFHDQVREYLVGKEAESGTGDERKPAEGGKAAVRAEEAEGRAEVKREAEPKKAAPAPPAKAGAVTTLPKREAAAKK